ncbi:MAG TPA: type II toxin-antitoxin system VapC family toxin [Caulobacteraceae bacterium]|nr:type II toxin-antitoxin system VapC family toxin [Caulobacteraceae bacterium]
MPDNGRPTLILDASVAAKMLFEEEDSNLARDWRKMARLTAPDFILIEMASIAAKRVRRHLCAGEEASRAVRDVARLIDHLTPSASLTPRAYEIARDHGVSAYNGLYLALAEKVGAAVLTADAKQVEKARAAGLGKLVRPLAA